MVLIKPSMIKDRSRTDIRHDAQRMMVFLEKKVEFQFDVMCGINNSIFDFYHCVCIIIKWK